MDQVLQAQIIGLAIRIYQDSFYFRQRITVELQQTTLSVRIRTAQLRIIEQRLLSTRVFHRQYSKRTLAFSVQHNYATQYEKYIVRLITLAV